MADKQTRTEQIVMVGEFRDGDDRTLAFNDPATDVFDAAAMASLGEQVNAFASFIKDKQILIGDKAGADFLRFKSAKILKKTVTDLDLTVRD